MRNLKLSLKFIGTNYHGFQKQKNAVTIQELLENAIKSITNENIKITGCSRTDSGVHALYYVCNFKTNSSIPCDRLPYAINFFLPSDVVVFDCKEADFDFHSRYSAKSKTYVYKILNNKFKNPFYNNLAYFYPNSINISKMKKAAKMFVGKNDFKAFMSEGSSVIDTVRTIFEISVTKKQDIIEIMVCGDGFLYNMVRIIAGTLLYVGIGKISENDILKIINRKDRKNAGITLKPDGLYLYNVEY